MEHLNQPRLVTEQIVSNQTEMTKADRITNLDVQLKTKRDLIGE